MDQAIESAFSGQLEGHSDVAQEVAKAFSNGSTLDHLLPRGTRLTTADVEIKLRSFIATELRRIARLRGLEAEVICDVSGRTLRAWANIDQTARKTSAQRKKAADDRL